MSERKVPEELAALEAELAGGAGRGMDPGPTALVVSVAMLALIVSLILPWTGSAQGWEVLAAVEWFGPLPLLFAVTALAFGLFGSALALATRWWGLGWTSAVGCGFSVLDGVWAIWSRQTVVLDGGSGPGPGMVVALLAVFVLAVSWVRIALRR